MDHLCLEYLKPRRHDSVETHGLDCGPYEHFSDEWWECSICGAKYTYEEAAELVIASVEKEERDSGTRQED